ncbi:potassium channel family protein [Paenibacillus lutrae]|uniref:Ion transporter n=1 Tax=Paenibacillus lutrae TaxID=2078573 RepID=A0A7X3FJZ8_9BACL|nr:potassium channel family protein [Paenibacillus lutrae]MVP01123.1 ion transporter [Paenibacillus lutrae]
MHFVLRYVNQMLRLSNGLIAILTVAFVLLCSLIAYWIEPDTFETWFNSLYWVMTTMATVGYGDYYMKTVPGKLFTIFLYLFGIGLLSLVIGKIIEAFSNVKLRRETGKVNYRGSNHIVVITWNKKAHSAVEELISSDPELEIVIIDENEKLPYDHKKVHYISGDPALETTLEKAGLSKARAAIIFADERSQDISLVDGKTLLIASSIERLAPDVHTTAEIMSEKHISNFRYVKVNDFILSHDAVSNLVVRSALNEGTIDLYMQLISRQHGDDLYEVGRKPQWVTYHDAFLDLLQQGATLIADRNDLGINRKLQEKIPADARLFVVCDPGTYLRISGKEIL